MTFRLFKIYRTIIILAFHFSALILISSFNYSDQEEVPYPAGYRSWTYVKTALIEKGNPAYAHWGGFHHIYVNKEAIAGYRSGKFADGSILVFDVLEAMSKDSAVIEGKRRLVDVMVRNTKQFRSTGGWGYEEFKGDSKLSEIFADLLPQPVIAVMLIKKVMTTYFLNLRITLIDLESPS